MKSTPKNYKEINLQSELKETQPLSTDFFPVSYLQSFLVTFDRSYC